MAKQPTPILSARGVRKTYVFGAIPVEVLRGADLDVSQGEWVAVLGSSGSGKSTLLHLMGGLDKPDRDGGTIRFQGTEVATTHGARLDLYRNREIGFVFQFYHLLPELNVLENAMLPAMVGHWFAQFSGRAVAARASASALLESFGLGHRLHHRPAQLSGGERQRVAIARALANSPRVLLADEPTGNLDVKTGEGILDLLSERHARGLTVVMVTHDPAVAARADRIVKLTDGRVEDEPPTASKPLKDNE
ncbi:MAG: ABC transporter ATP-binding protein [Phycisphaerales bacterium]|nr:ABC transporter ATP-binding protein [Phycisphaerales bacterium]